MADYNSLLQRYNNQLAEQRLLLQQWVSTAVTQYDALPQDVKDTLPKLPGRTAQELVPALFAETITASEEAAYKQQITVLEQFVTACNAKVDEINALEVVRCKL